MERVNFQIFKPMKNKNLFQQGVFTLHSGETTDFKIECDSLTDSDIDTIALLVSQRYKFHGVVGVPTGGLRLANALKKYCKETHPLLLIVDDVITTGASMKETASQHKGFIRGVAIFSRTQCPAWIVPIFQMWNFKTTG